MITMDSDQLQIMIEDYIMHIKNGHSRSAVANPLYALEAFLDINDVQINWRKVRRLLPAQAKKAGKHAWSTKDIQKILAHTADVRAKALIHFLASTGVRIGAITDIKIKHVKNRDEDCKSVCVYADDKEEYHTFLTPEASQYLDRYIEKRRTDGENITDDSPLFRTAYTIGISPVKALSQDAMENIIYRILCRIGMRGNGNGKRNSVAIHHGFRKRFNTIMKTTPGINPHLVEKMMGHSTTIPLDDAYLDSSIDQLFEEFKKAVPSLVIDDSERHRLEIEKAEKKATELQEKVFEINKLKQKVYEFESFKEDMRQEFKDMIKDLKLQSKK